MKEINIEIHSEPGDNVNPRAVLSYASSEDFFETVVTFLKDKSPKLNIYVIPKSVKGGEISFTSYFGEKFEQSDKNKFLYQKKKEKRS